MTMMDKVQINPLITNETRETLRRACQERGLAQGDIVELALRAFLTSDECETADRLGPRLRTIEEALTVLLGLVQVLLDRQNGEAKAPTPAAPIATYEQMYGPIPEAPPAVEAASEPRRGGWWSFREKRA
jgi:hypothetical protein